MVLSEVKCLTMMFGSGVSTYGTRYGMVVLSRNNEITTTAVPAGTSRVSQCDGPITGYGLVRYAILSLPHSKLVPSTQMQ